MMSAMALTLGNCTPGVMLISEARSLRGPHVGRCLRAATMTSLTSTGIWLAVWCARCERSCSASSSWPDAR